MFDQNLQRALSELDKGAKKTKRTDSKKIIAFGFVLAFATIGGLWVTEKPVPKVSVDHLARMVIIASRTSNNDPIRLLGDVERHMGKRLQDLSSNERAAALNFLMSHIDLHHYREQLISY